MLSKPAGLLLLLLPLPAMAAWTGIAAFIGQSDSDWLYADQVRQANINYYGIRIEEKSQLAIRVGAGAGHFDLRQSDPLNENAAQKHGGQFLFFYLRWPIKMAEHITLHQRINYQFNTGTTDILEDKTEINWNEVSFDIGVSIKYGLLSVRPFLNYRSIDGDITSNNGTHLFKLKHALSSGVKLDLFVEHTAYIRLMATTENNTSLRLSFVREY